MSASIPNPQKQLAPAAITRRELIVRDTVTFLVLASITAALSLVTWLLFQSFTAHREDLAKRWAARGRGELAAGHPDLAIVSLRTALSYSPDNHDDELLLAESLGAAGHIEEADNYFLGLWDAAPGDGFINLQLARLARKQNRARQAIEYYRASIFGNWGDQGVVRRREVRLELANYLIERHQLEEARAELLIAGSNNPSDAGLDLVIGDALLRAGDRNDALSYYRKSIALQPENRTALEDAGRLTFDMGNYPEARGLLLRANRAQPAPGQPKREPDLSNLIEDADRLMALDLSRDLPSRVRAEHLLDAANIAKKRLDDCTQQLTPQTGAPAAAGIGISSPELLALSAEWSPLMTRAGRAAIAHDPDTQDTVAQLIGDTEVDTAKLCGPPKGDDALLLKLATAANAQGQ